LKKTSGSKKRGSQRGTVSKQKRRLREGRKAGDCWKTEGGSHASAINNRAVVMVYNNDHRDHEGLEGGNTFRSRGSKPRKDGFCLRRTRKVGKRTDPEGKKQKARSPGAQSVKQGKSVQLRRKLKGETKHQRLGKRHTNLRVNVSDCAPWKRRGGALKKRGGVRKGNHL